MPANITPVLIMVFLSVGLLTGAVASVVLARIDPARRRLRALTQTKSGSGLLKENVRVLELVDPRWDAIVAKLPPPLNLTKRLRRDLNFAGIESSRGIALYLLSQPITALVFGTAGLFVFEDSRRFAVALIAAVIGFLLPGFLLSRQIADRRKQIENGLADALDLLVLCLEAGSSLDQALAKATEELELSYPGLAYQLRIVINETRAGKPRTEAFRGFADRTKIDEARSLVTMLVQTDKFGTSIAQALRIYGNVCRTKRRQRAEERAEKVGAKLVVPLVFCLFPALFVVILGPAVILFMRAFSAIQP